MWDIEEVAKVIRHSLESVFHVVVEWNWIRYYIFYRMENIV
jgi:hypothetical protein